MKVPKDSLIPPNGFHFKSDDLYIEGSSYQDVAEKLLRYRLENNVSTGNPMAEVLDYICNSWPHFCSDTSPISPLNMKPAPSLTARVTAWMASLYRTLRGTNISESYVDQGEANRRAAICLACPFHVEWRRGCSSCIEGTQRVGYTFRGGRQAAHEAKLMSCSILGHEAKTAVWVKTPPPPTTEQHSDLPTNCWMKP
jgi:hypothetical protein